VQPLLGDLAVQHEPSPVADRGQQRLGAMIDRWAAGALTGQPDQRGAVTVIGLAPLERRWEPSWARAARVSGGANSQTEPG
jgi:hypothetical protein